MDSQPFERFAALCALAAAAAGFGYSPAFVIHLDGESRSAAYATSPLRTERR